MLLRDAPDGSLVYFVRVGKFVKIGVTTDLAQRLRSFRTGTAENMEVLGTFPGTRADEARLHRAFAKNRVRGEFFHLEFRLANFIDIVTAGHVDAAWAWLSQSSEEERLRLKEKARQDRVRVQRATKAERDAECARLRAERKARLGW